MRPCHLSACLLTVLASFNARGQVDPPIVPSDAQTPFRYLATAPIPFPMGCPTGGTAVCPGSPSWATSDLFGGTPPPGLEGYCVYESDTGVLSDLQALVALGCLTDLEPDIMAVTPFANPQAYEDLVWEPLRESFLRQAGSLPGDAAPTQAQVRLSIIDTQPTQQLSQPGNALHGFSLARMADELICTGEERCGVDIRTRLALPYLDFCASCRDPNGGYFGTIGELASAVRAEVADWVQANDDVERRLVLNASVGWDPRYGSFSFAGDTPLPVQAMVDALRDASCRGAIIVAAAGNRLAGPENTVGPLLPGGWEDLPAPGFQYCRLNTEPGAVDEADFPPPGTEYRPLVYGAGAIGLDNRALELRPRGEPPRTGYGLQAVADAQTMPGGAPSEIQTGTSVGALVVSAAAAAAWAYAPSFPDFKLMGLVDESGENLGRLAQYCLPPGPAACAREVQRIRVCPAVAAVCQDDSDGLCPVGGVTCPPLDRSPPDLPFVDIEMLFEDPTIQRVSTTELTQVSRDAASCGASWRLRSHPLDPVDDLCPQRQYYAMQATPWTNPQPASQPCPTCTGRFQSPGTLYLEIADEFLGEVSDVTLVCGNIGFRLPLDGPVLSPDDRYLVTNIPEACAQHLQVAWRVLNTSPDPTVSALTTVFSYQAQGRPGAHYTH